MRISWDSYAAGQTVTGTPTAATGFGYENLLRSERTLTTKTAATSTIMEVYVTWGYAAPIDVVALFGLPAGIGGASALNATVSTWNGTAWVQAATTIFNGSLPNNGAFARLGHYENRNLIWRPSAPVTGQGVYIGLSVASAITWTASRLWAGSAWAPTKGFAPGATFAIRDTSEHIRAQDGTMRTIPGPIYRSMSLPLSYMSDADREILHYYHVYPFGSLKTRDRLVMPFWREGSLREASETWFGRVSGDIDAAIRPVWLPTGAENYYAGSLDFEEI